MSTIRITASVPSDKRGATITLLQALGAKLLVVSLDGDEAIDSDPTPPHGVSRDGVMLTRERYEELFDAERQHDQLLGQVTDLRRTHSQMKLDFGKVYDIVNHWRLR